jgi:hypothetical protein
MDAILNQLKQEKHKVLHDDVARLSRLIHDHLNMLGRYSFTVSESIAGSELRPLYNPNQEAEFIAAKHPNHRY